MFTFEIIMYPSVLMQGNPLLNHLDSTYLEYTFTCMLTYNLRFPFFEGRQDNRTKWKTRRSHEHTSLSNLRNK